LESLFFIKFLSISLFLPAFSLILPFEHRTGVELPPQPGGLQKIFPQIFRKDIVFRRQLWYNNYLEKTVFIDTVK